MFVEPKPTILKRRIKNRYYQKNRPDCEIDSLGDFLFNPAVINVFLCIMKKIAGLIIFLLLSTSAFAQSKTKLAKEESAKMTQDQRVLYEVDRKSKHGKKDISMRKKVRIDKKQARKSRRIKQPKRKG
jgi:hypothetical protein